jgi:arylsulfatase A-like enzyme
VRTTYFNSADARALPTCGGLALFFLCLELLKAQRASQWAGFLSRDIAGGVFAFAVYAFVIAFVFCAVRRVLQRAPRLAYFAESFALLCGGCTVWALLSVHREETPTLDDVIVATALIGCCAAMALGHGRWYSTARFGALSLLLGLAGISALFAAGEYFLFSVDRAAQVTIYPALWVCVCALLLLATQIAVPRIRVLAALGLLGVALPPLLVWVLLRPTAKGPEPARPNLVFMIADTLRADYCSAYGGQVPTPNLERLAASGTRFDRGYSLAPWTLPSMTGLLSSQYPKSLTPGSGHTIWSLQMNRYEVDLAEPTLPMRLEAEGYATGAVTANAFLPSIPGAMEGIQTRASSHPILLREEGYFAVLPFLGALVEDWFPALAEIRPHNTTRDLDHYARAFIKRHRNQPFFLWVHYIDPHAPYDPPESLRRVQDGPWPFFHPYVGGEQWGLPILGQNFEVAELDRDYVKSLYEGEVAYIDQFAGRFLDALEAEGVGDNTFVCFTSDHGEELWDHGEWGHGQSLYEEQLHVPLILAGPGIGAQVVREPVSAIHLVPTLAEIMSIAPANTWKGKSLAPLLRGEVATPPAQPIFAQGTTNKTETPMHTVILGDYKLIRIAGSDVVQLYNLAADPDEKQDLALEQPERVKELAAMLDAWLASFPSFFEAEEQPFNQELEQGLEGMGYL